MVADLGGLFEVWADDWSLVENYRFGTRTCDFLICRRCGAVIAGSRGNDGRTARGRQCELLERSCALHVGSCAYDFEGETSETRSSRHAANWMSAIIRR